MLNKSHHRNSRQSGFSLIELLLVVAILGILTTVALPNLERAKDNAEKGAIVALLHLIHNTQVEFYSKNRRFGRIQEISQSGGPQYGRLQGATLLYRNNYVVYTSPVNPSDASLATGYTVLAVRRGHGTPFVFSVDQSGTIQQVAPTPGYGL